MKVKAARAWDQNWLTWAWAVPRPRGCWRMKVGAKGQEQLRDQSAARGQSTLCGPNYPKWNRMLVKVGRHPRPSDG